MQASIEFSCGEVIKNVGMPSLAMNAHLFHHPTETAEQRACIEETKKDIEKYKGVVF